MSDDTEDTLRARIAEWESWARGHLLMPIEPMTDEHMRELLDDIIIDGHEAIRYPSW